MSFLDKWFPIEHRLSLFILFVCWFCEILFGTGARCVVIFGLVWSTYIIKLLVDIHHELRVSNITTQILLRHQTLRTAEYRDDKESL